VTFGTVVGHARALEVLRRALAADATAGGFLFAGPAGVGKRLAAEEFARGVLCEGPRRPCGTCRGCRLPAGAPHPDVVRCEPLEGRKQLLVEQVREFGAAIALSPAWGTRRVGVIDPAEALTTAAANALLKTLEEPPPGRTIVLVCARPGALPATVLSRCRRVSFGALADDEVATVLQRARGWPAEAARTAAALAGGSAGAALAREGKGWQEAVGAARALAAALGGGGRGPLLAAAEGARERDAALLAVEVLLSWLRGAARGDRAGSAPPELAAVGPGEAAELMARALAVHRRLEANANAKLALAALGGERGR